MGKTGAGTAATTVALKRPTGWCIQHLNHHLRLSTRGLNISSAKRIWAWAWRRLLEMCEKHQGALVLLAVQQLAICVGWKQERKRQERESAAIWISNHEIRTFEFSGLSSGTDLLKWFGSTHLGCELTFDNFMEGTFSVIRLLSPPLRFFVHLSSKDVQAAAWSTFFRGSITTCCMWRHRFKPGSAWT